MSAQARPNPIVSPALAVVLALAAGCGGTNTPGPDAGQPADAGATPAIVVAERVFTPDSRLYYLSVVSEVPTGKLDRSKAREFTSADLEVFDGAIFLRDRQANTMTRFSVGNDLSLVEEGKFSFQSTGLPSSRAYSAYLSPTQAYVLDGKGRRMIGWNPKEMKLTGETKSLAFLEKTDLPDLSLGVPTTVGSQVFVPVSWSDSANLVIAAGAAVMIIDSTMAKDPVVLEDDRVGGSYVVWGLGGDAYVGGTVGGDVKLFGHALGGGAAPNAGVVRVKSGASAFDSSYSVDLDKATGTIGSWGIHLLDATHVLAQILDPAVDKASIATPDDFYASTEFFYVLLDTATGTWTRQDAIPKGGVGNAQEHVVDGVLYVQVSGPNAAEVHGVTAANGIGAKVFEVPSGDLWFMRRLR
ncbi:MAG: hypothetical protein QM765_27675 [Myxococcales bacterium]